MGAADAQSANRVTLGILLRIESRTPAAETQHSDTAMWAEKVARNTNVLSQKQISTELKAGQHRLDSSESECNTNYSRFK